MTLGASFKPSEKANNTTLHAAAVTDEDLVEGSTLKVDIGALLIVLGVKNKKKMAIVHPPFHRSCPCTHVLMRHLHQTVCERGILFYIHREVQEIFIFASDRLTT